MLYLMLCTLKYAKGLSLPLDKNFIFRMCVAESDREKERERQTDTERQVNICRASVTLSGVLKSLVHFICLNQSTFPNALKHFLTEKQYTKNKYTVSRCCDIEISRSPNTIYQKTCILLN